jgi:hypothetical protein
MSGPSAPIGIYGLWSVTFKDRVSKLPQAMIKVAAEFTCPFEADMEDYVGGGSKFVLASEPKYIKADAAFQIKQFNKESYLYLGAGSDASGSAEPTGAVTAPANAKGTSAVAATGIATIAVKGGSEKDLKTGDYVGVVVSASTIDLYCDSDVDFGGVYTGGTATQFIDDTNKITAAPLSITMGGTVDVASYGISITGGASAISMTTGDTFTFSVRAANIANEVITLGDRNTFFKSYSVVATMVPKSITGEVMYIYMPIVQVSGLTIAPKEYAWVSSSPKLKVLRSESENMVAKIKRVQRMLA